MKTFEQIGVECGVLYNCDNNGIHVESDISMINLFDFATNIVNEVFKELDKADVEYSYKVQDIILHKLGL